jgi:hypothetical protein
MKGNYAHVRELLDLYYSRRAIKYNATTQVVTEAKIKAIYTSNNTGLDITPSYTLNANQKIYLKAIINIRASEFCGEGQRWFDIKRMHMAITHKIFPNSYITLTANDNRRVVPLPTDALAGIKLPDPSNPTAGPNNIKTVRELTPSEISAPQLYKEEEVVIE